MPRDRNTLPTASEARRMYEVIPTNIWYKAEDEWYNRGESDTKLLDRLTDVHHGAGESWDITALPVNSKKAVTFTVKG